MVREILLVDDEPSLCKALKSFFEERGFRVETATTGQAALERLQQTPADIVLLDLKLPDCSGLEVLSYLKEHAPTSRVVVISSLTDQETIREAINMGADQYLTKPFDFSHCFHAAMGVDMIDLAAAQSEPEAIARVPRSIAEQYRVLPLRIHDGILEVAAADALDQKSLEQLGLLLQCQVRASAAIGDDLAQVIRRSYGDTSAQAVPASRPSSTQPHPLPTNVSATARASGANDTAHLVDQLLRRAVARQATDLHLGVGPKGPWCRVRIDGVLHELPSPPDLTKRYPSLVAHLKRIANLDVAESHLPQEGRSRWLLDAAPFTLQLSILPTPYGESVAIRLLAPSRLLRLDQLGFSEEQQGQLERVLNRPSGLVLVTGPDGSGKSSTLYALLAALNTGHFNIVTVEGSVECDLPGVTQVAVQANAGLTFARGLRSVLAHDPDIIMVGEIRDQETAGLAVWAALTGHVVLAALHTTDAANAITRLFDLGIEPFLLCSTVSAILSQRLVRLLCPKCRESVQLDTTNLAPLGIVVPAAQQQQPLRIWRARRCRACQATGYQGRTGIFELLMVDHHLRSLIIKRASAAQIRQSAMSKGMTSLWQAGWQHLNAGRTSFEELSRVLTSITTP